MTRGKSLGRVIWIDFGRDVGRSAAANSSDDVLGTDPGKFHDGPSKISARPSCDGDTNTTTDNTDVDGKDSLTRLHQRLEIIEGQMQQQAETMVTGQDSLEKRMDIIVDGIVQQPDGIAQQARESKSQILDNFVSLDSKMGKVAHTQEQQGRLHTAHIFELQQGTTKTRGQLLVS